MNEETTTPGLSALNPELTERVTERMRYISRSSRITAAVVIAGSITVGGGAAASVLRNSPGRLGDRSFPISTLLPVATILLVAATAVYVSIYLLRLSRAAGMVSQDNCLHQIEEATWRARAFWRSAAAAGTAVALIAIVTVGIHLFYSTASKLNADRRYHNTLSRIQSLGESLEAYAQDHGSYPPTTALKDLQRWLVPRYITEIHSSDHWGNPLHYIPICEEEHCYDFRIISPGSDHAKGLERHEYLHLDDPSYPVRSDRTHKEFDSVLQRQLAVLEEDVVFGQGRFLKLPRWRLDP